MRGTSSYASASDHEPSDSEPAPAPGKRSRTADFLSHAVHDHAGQAGDAGGGGERLPFLDMMLRAEAGAPLPAPLRARMEDGFGADFGGVSVHAGSAATAGAGARAMAAGEHVGLAPGEWSPDTAGGQELIAHELAHVVQQRQGRAAAAQGKGGPVLSPSLEREADDAAARVVRGEPAGLGAAPANGGDAPALQLKQNELRSILYTDLNPTTGLEKQQDKWVDAFVSDVEEALATWRKQRGTPDLAFKQDQEIKINTALKTFRRAAAKDPAFDLLMEAARSRLASGKNAAYVREIRMFNPWSLTELKYLMNVEDAEPSHKYEMRPVGGTTIEANVGVGKGGKVYKSIEVRYTNTLIPGLTWTQTVELDGWMLGAGVSLDAVLKKMGKGKKPKKPKPDSKDDHDANGGVQFSGSGGFEEAKEMPRDNYLAPGFFKGAQFTSPSVSGSASFTALDGKGGAGALLIRKGAESLLWESELSFTAEAGFDLAQLGDMLFEDSLGGLGDSGFDAGVDGTVEFGKTSLDGPLDFQAGEWGELEEVQPVLTEAWIPLHYARLYFDHGKDEPDAADVETIRSLSRMIHEFHDDTRRNPSKLFKVEVLGCHSQVFAEYDHELKILEARQERRGTLSDRDQQRLYELRLQKEMENYALAMRRATNSYGELLNALYALDRSDPAWRNVLEWSEIGPPRTRDPENQNPYSSSSQDRSATIVVSYQVNNTISGAFAGARRRRVAEDQGE